MDLRNVPFFLLVFCLLAGCTSIRTPMKLNIQGAEVINVSPFMGKTFYRAYYYDSLVMYENQYMNDSIVTRLSGTETIQDSKSREWLSRYFVFHVDSSFGYSYNYVNNFQNDMRLRVDSEMVHIKGFNSLESIPPADSVIWNSDKTELWEKWIWQEKRDKNLPAGNLTLVYSKNMNHLRESLNPKLDARKGMKLYKIDMRYESFTDSTNKTWAPTTDLTELKEISTIDTSKIMPVLRRYSREVQKKM